MSMSLVSAHARARASVPAWLQVQAQQDAAAGSVGLSA